jgi:predicted metal-binding membrane protein
MASQRRTSILLLAAVVAAWAVTVERMEGMDAGPGTDLGGLGWYLGIWVTMTVAMMLPSVAPLVARVRRAFPSVLFTAGYLAAWTAYGLAAYGVYRLLESLGPGWLAWDRGGPYVAGGAIVAAGLYELTPLKRRFLSRCRVPFGDAGGQGPLRVGLANGIDCVGCCFALMAVLFALGVMSVFWMAVVAGVIFAEKVLRHGARLTRFVAPALVALGIWVSFSPGSVPMLTQPDQSPSMHMDP